MTTLDDLRRIRDTARKSMLVRDSGERPQVKVAMGTCGIAAGARAVVSAVLDELAARDVSDVAVTLTDCMGQCQSEPMLDVQRPGEVEVVYARVTPEIARKIVAQHVIGGQPVAENVAS